MGPLETTSAILGRLNAPFAWMVGSRTGARYCLATWVFLRLLGLVYLAAFLSLAVQVQGLIGPQGILPAQEYLDAVRQAVGSARFHLAPTLFWLGAGPDALTLACGAGVVAAGLLILDVWPLVCLILLWILYLSLVVVGQDFLEFQWDALLLETGVLALLVAPHHVLPGADRRRAPPTIGVFLLWWLLFRLVFESGWVKLASGDPTWRNLTALEYHYWTQPLPTWTAWYADQLPVWTKHVSVAGTFVLELFFPLLIFCGRWLRRWACAGIVFLQLLILGTGNYAFFNFLTIALSLTLLDDALWQRVLPSGLRRILGDAPPGASDRATALAMATGLPLLLLSAGTLWQTVTARPWLVEPLRGPYALVAPFRSVNSYGLFRVMTTRRLEISVEGSADGRVWQAYEFRDKPGDLSRRPGFVEPHQPRLDWQMWFAALGRFDTTPWFQLLMLRLLQGSRSVLDLLATNPFPNHPPRYLRAMLYDYRFATEEERRGTGAWWSRTLVGIYAPVLSLPELEPVP
jgi:hypothetical protein